jgi:hypothetical protein
MKGWLMNMEQLVEWVLAGETEELGKTYLNATSSATNPTLHDLGSNLDCGGGKPASYGTAEFYCQGISHII